MNRANATPTAAHIVTRPQPTPMDSVLGSPHLPNDNDDSRLLRAYQHNSADLRDIIYLSVGETWSRPAAGLVERLAHVPAYSHGYILAPHGLPTLHTALRKFITDTHRLDDLTIGTDFEVAVTQNGTRNAMFDFARLLVRTSDASGQPQLVCSAPGWEYPEVFASLGYQTHRFNLSPEGSYQPDSAEVSEILRHASGAARGAPVVLVLNAQHNPTGAQWDHSAVTAMITAAADTHAALLIDDAYYAVSDPPGPAVNCLRIVVTQFRDALTWLAVRSLGKQFHCNGWGVGVLTSTPQIVNVMVNQQLAQHAFVSSVPLQAAMAEWLNTPACQQYSAHIAAEYQKKRRWFSQQLHTVLGFPDHAYFTGTATPYLRAQVPPAYTGPGAQYRYRRDCLLHAAVLPGAGDTAAASPQTADSNRGFVRFYLGGSHAELKEAIQRIDHAGMNWTNQPRP
jgi:aspartate/methionine/tyrosine aminotransferase